MGTLPERTNYPGIVHSKGEPSRPGHIVLVEENECLGDQHVFREPLDITGPDNFGRILQIGAVIGRIDGCKRKERKVFGIDKKIDKPSWALTFEYLHTNDAANGGS